MKRIVLSSAFTSLFLILVGCGTDPRAQLRVVHAVPDAPKVDALLDGKVVVSGAAYTDVTKYLTVKTGIRRVKVNLAGTNTTVITADTPSLSAKKYYTVLAVGQVKNATLGALYLTDDRTAPAAGQSKLRAVHASPNAGTVDIYIAKPTDPVPSTPTIPNVTFKTVSAYTTLPAATYEVCVNPSGVKPPSLTTCTVSASVTLASGQNRTVVALDPSSGKTAFQVVVLPDLQ